MATTLMSRSSDGSSTARPDGVLEVRQRLDHAHQAAVGELRDDRGDGLDRAGHSRIRVVDAQQHLAAVEPAGLDVVRVVGRHAVVELPVGADDAAAVHRADREPAIERAEPRELLEDVGTGEHTVDAGLGQGAHEPVEQRVAVSDRERIAAGREHAARRVVGGQDEETAVGRRRRCGGHGPASAERRLSGSNTRASMSASYFSRSRFALMPAPSPRGRPPWASRRRRSAGPTRMLRQRWRTCRCAARPSRSAGRGTARHRRHRRRPGRRRPSTGTGATRHRPSDCRQQRAVRPQLHDGQLHAGGQQRVGCCVRDRPCRPPCGTPRDCRPRRSTGRSLPGPRHGPSRRSGHRAAR